jgi:hypothetical protein
MDARGILPVEVRFYSDGDRQEVENFHCAQRRWEKEAQGVIRRAPSLLVEEGVELLVATADGEVVGVTVFLAIPGLCFIYSIGVLTSQWNRGVGTRLKKAVMVEAKERSPQGCMFLSFVHKMNGRMNSINRNLNAETRISPDDGNYFFTYISVKLEDEV